MDQEKQAKIDAVAAEIEEITVATAKELLKQPFPDVIKVPVTFKLVTGKKRRIVKVKRGPGKGRVRKSWLRVYPVKFTFREDNGSPIREFFDTWAKAVIKPAEYTEKSL